MSMYLLDTLTPFFWACDWIESLYTDKNSLAAQPESRCLSVPPVVRFAPRTSNMVAVRCALYANVGLDALFQKLIYALKQAPLNDRIIVNSLSFDCLVLIS